MPTPQLKDHTMREIARPNNDTLYISALLDLRKDPVILEMPAFDSDYVSLMVTGYDHYVNVPMATRLGDFKKPEKMLFYTERTEGYDGKPVEGVDRIFECTGDFISAVLRIMPHAKDQERFQRIVEQMEQVKITTLSEFQGGKAKPIDDIEFPAVGKRDADIFGNNLLEVMQFVFNHTTFDPQDELDRELLAAYEPLGVVPGQPYDPAKVAKIDGAKFRKVSERIFTEEMAKTTDEEFSKKELFGKFKPKGQMPLELLLFQSVLGPIGLPATEAVYPAVTTTDGKPMNAMNDYVIRMSADELPPTDVFWSLTLYDLNNGFFIPNDHKKYSVGENAGMKLNENGGIEIYVAAEKPEGVPEENWLPINRKDEDMDIVLRVYVADLEKMKTWTAPRRRSSQRAEIRANHEQARREQYRYSPNISPTSERIDEQDEPHNETSHAQRAGGRLQPPAGVSRLSQDSQTPPADWRGQYAYTLGVQAYVFAFPWSYLPELRYAWVTQEPSNASTPYAPLNHFWHMWKLADADYRDGGSPNYDTLYSLAWLDVGKEPVILSHPDVKDRHFTFQIASMSSDNVDDVGSRTTGLKAGHFAITGPDWKGRTSAGSEASETVPDRRSVSLRTYRSNGTGRCCCQTGSSVNTN